MTRTARQPLVAHTGELACSLLVPADWFVHEIPATAQDFGDVAAMALLAIGHNATNTIMLTVDARPTFTSGTVTRWAHALLEARGLTVYWINEQAVGSLNGVAGMAIDAMSEDTAGTWFAFVEVKQRIVRLTMTAQEQLPGAALAIWTPALESFALVDAEGIAIRDIPPVDDWWARAKQLEYENRLDEAEAVIADAVPHIGSGVQTAQLYADRMTRLKAQGDQAGAADAHERASDWIWRYASWATSGGEGAALSLERDEFLSKLGPVP